MQIVWFSNAGAGVIFFLPIFIFNKVFCHKKNLDFNVVTKLRGLICLFYYFLKGLFINIYRTFFISEISWMFPVIMKYSIIY